MGTQTTWINQHQQDLMDSISHIALYRMKASGSSTNENISLLEDHEVLRVVPTKSRTGNIVTLSFVIPAGSIVCPSATISSVNSDKTQITVDDATNFFNEDETILIDLVNQTERTIIAKSGNILTLDTALPGNVTVVGVSIKGLLTRASIIIDGNEDDHTGTIMRTFNINDRYLNESSPAQPAIKTSFPLLSN
jgi:hypothetical protein